MTRKTATVNKPDKVLFPDTGRTKADVADYYRRIAKVMLPLIRGRPLTLHRFPDGIDGVNFIQKNVSEHFPDWIARTTVDKEDGTVTHPLAEDADTLTYLVDQGTIAFHVWLSRADKPRRPDRLIFDLDPPDGAPKDAPNNEFAPVIEAARTLRATLDALGLTSFVMTTGSSGLHVAVPLNRRAGFDTVRDFAQEIAHQMADERPDAFTTEQRKNKRAGRVYLDVQRNAYAQTGIAPYSVRAKPGAPIATPLEWNEVRDASLHPQRYGIGNIFRRLARRDCPWAGIDRHRQDVREAAKRLHERG